MHRRKLLKSVAALPLLALAPPLIAAPPAPLRRVRPGDPAWPNAADWRSLDEAVGGALLEVRSLFSACASDGGSVGCRDVLANMQNPFYIGDQPAGTQVSGWLDAWAPAPSAYAVKARNSADVAAAINFARQRQLRIAVKGGGHSYQGTSSAPDSLLIWLRAMNQVTVHDAFVPAGCADKLSPVPAVSAGAGAMWIDLYDAVTTRGGRYVQGGGCTTVGVAGLIQSGGFGSFSKKYGLAAAGLLEAEVVTADGVARIANACTNPDLFWGLKGGGGGSLGVVTRVTLRTRELPAFFGDVFGTITAGSETAFRELIARAVSFYADRLLNPHWGEQMRFGTGNKLEISMEFQGLTQLQAEEVWKPFREWLAAPGRDVKIDVPLMIDSGPARFYWSGQLLKAFAPEAIVADDRPKAPASNFYWAGCREEVGWVLYAFRSAWLPVSLLQKKEQPRLVEALFESTRHWQMSLHFNKGLAGAPAEEIAAAKDTAINPAVLDAFALAICGAGGPPAFPGIKGHEPNLNEAGRAASAVTKSMNKLLEVVDEPGSYVSENDFFESQWG